MDNFGYNKEYAKKMRKAEWKLPPWIDE